MEECHTLRAEAALCRELAREMTDPRSIAMFLERAERLEARAAALEIQRTQQCAGSGIELLCGRAVTLATAGARATIGPSAAEDFATGTEK